MFLIAYSKEWLVYEMFWLVKIKKGRVLYHFSDLLKGKSHPVSVWEGKLRAVE